MRKQIAVMTMSVFSAMLLLADMAFGASSFVTDAVRPGNCLAPGAVSVEIPQARAQASKTYQNPDGSRTWVASSGSIHYRDGQGRWQDIDLAIRPLSSILRPFVYGMEQNAYQSFFAAGADEPILARFQTGNWSVTFGIENGSPGHVDIAGNMITYRGALASADMRFRTCADELREEIILNRPPSAAKWEFPIYLEGVRLQDNKNGGLDFVDIKTNSRVWSMPRPYMIDARGVRSEAVSKKLCIRNGGTFLSIDADSRWLSAGDRAYPVVVDPTFTSQPPQIDAHVSNKTGQADTNYGGAGTALNINATETGANGVRRSLAAWDMTSAPIQDQVVDAANSVRVKMRAYSRNIDTSHPNLALGNVRMHMITSTWIETGTGSVTWNNMPTWTSASYLAQTSVGTTVPAWYTWSYNGRTEGLPVSNQGFLLKAATEAFGTGNGFAGVNFDSKDYNEGYSSYSPILEIDYVEPCTQLYAPAAATATDVTSCQINWNWGANGNTCLTGYRIYDVATGGTPLQTVSSTTLNWLETGLTASTSYTRWVAAYWGPNESSRTALGATSTTAPPAPVAAAPTNVTFNSIQWNWGQNNNECEDGFKIYDAATGGNLIQTLAANVVSWSEEGLAPETAYSRWVSAYQGTVESARTKLGPVTTPAARPCLLNAGFEDGFTSGVGNSWTQFALIGTATCAANTSVVHGGTTSQQVYSANSSNQGGVYQQFPTTVGLSYSVTVYMKTSSSSVMQGVLGVDPAGGTNYNDVPPTAKNTTNSTSWSIQQVTVTAEADRITVYLLAQSTKTATSGYVYFDDCTPDCAAAPQAPTIAQHPSNQSIATGGTATFTVVATGDPPLSYQWQKNSANLSDGGHVAGATTATLTISTANSGDAGNYRCVVTNPYGNATSNAASLTVTTPPAITQHPTAQTLAAGATATFTVVASGDPTLTYQWQKNSANLSNGGKISGATTATLQITNVADADEGNYRCVVTNSAGSATSNAAALTVNTPPTITQHPTNQAVANGGTATFTVVATGDPTLTYQWQKNSSNLSNGGHVAGATTATLTISTVDSGDVASYRCVVTNPYGSATSNTATLTISTNPVPPTITQQPANQAVALGGTATFTVAATGDTPLSYQWQKNSVNLSNGGHVSGATTATLTISPADDSDADNYRCVVTNSAGSATSNAATLTINHAAPTITQHPTNQTVAPGATATFTVAATGDPTLTYQWQKNSTNMSNGGHYSGVTTVTLTISSADSNDQATYRCVVTNPYGNATSNAATLTVSSTNQPPTITRQPGAQTLPQGRTAMFSVLASGSTPLMYQWQKNGANISDINGASGTATPTLLIFNVNSTDHAGNYRCVVTNAYGTATSNAVALTIGTGSSLPTITLQPTAQSVCENGTASFNTAASGSGTLIYQWRNDTGNVLDDDRISGAMTPTLTISNVTSTDGGEYWCMVGGSSGASQTSTAALSLGSALTITQQPQPQRVVAGANATLTVTAESGGTIGYRWQKDGANLSDGGRISGATTATLLITGAVVADTGLYRCIVTGCGSMTTNAVLLTVANTVSADFDGDTDVDMTDFSLLQMCLGTTSALSHPTCAITDLNADNTVDKNDITVFKGCLSGPDIPANPACAGS